MNEQMKQLLVDDYILRAKMADEARIASLAIDHKTTEDLARLIISNAKETGLYEERLQAGAKQKQPSKRKQGGRR